MLNEDTNSNNPAIQDAREKAKQSCKELAQRMLALLPTVEEGLDKISAQLDSQQIGSSVLMLQDIASAIDSYANAMETVFFENDDIDKVTAPLLDVQEGLGMLIAKYEAGDIGIVKAYFNNEFKPLFRKFSQALQENLGEALI